MVSDWNRPGARFSPHLHVTQMGCATVIPDFLSKRIATNPPIIHITFTKRRRTYERIPESNWWKRFNKQKKKNCCCCCCCCCGGGGGGGGWEGEGFVAIHEVWEDSLSHCKPFPTYPAKHVHLNVPAVFVHFAALWQLSLPMAHSSISEQ